MKQLILVSLTIIFCSCNKQKNTLTIDYRITGLNWIINSNDTVKKTPNRHNREDEIIVDRKILNNPDLVTSINWKDSTSIIEGNVIIKQSILTTTLKTDTFYICEENENSQKYVITGKTESKHLIINHKTDSLNYLINGTFNDTIQINNENEKYAEKMAYNVAHKTLYEIIHNEIYKEVEKIASR